MRSKTGKSHQWQPEQWSQGGQIGNIQSNRSAFAKTPHRAGNQNNQVRRAGNYLNRDKPGHFARECHSAFKQNIPQQKGTRNNNGNKNMQFAHKVTAIAKENDALFNENIEEGAVGYTSNNINSVPNCNVNKSQFHDALKLAKLQNQINNYHNQQIFADSGLAVTIIRSYFLKQIKY